MLGPSISHPVPEISKQLKIVKNQKSSLGKIDLDLSEKKEVVRIKAKYEDKARHREWKRTTITRVIAFTAAQSRFGLSDADIATILAETVS